MATEPFWRREQVDSGRRLTCFRATFAGVSAKQTLFHVVVTRSGPEYDRSRPLEEQSGWTEHAAFMDELVAAGFILLGGPLADEYRVVHAVRAGSEEEVRATLARDPWNETHLVVDSVDRWTIRLGDWHR